MFSVNNNKKLGAFIRNLRERKELTQEQFADLLETSQSAVARMEAGGQNFTTETLSKISEVLNHKIYTIGDNSIDFKISGNRELSGEITTNFSKNGAMGLLAASLVNKGKTVLHGIPKIEEVNRILEVMESLGVKVEWIEKNSLEIIPPKVFALENIDRNSASRTRTIIMFLGSLVHYFDDFRIPFPSGCNLGKRSNSAHVLGLQEFGAKIKVNKDNFWIRSNGLKPKEIIMFEKGDTATENLIICAARIPGKTVIKYCSSNYMVQDVCFFLQKLGVKIEGVGTGTLSIWGLAEIDQDIEHYNSQDPIESMMFLSAAIVTNSSITIRACPIDFLELELQRLKLMGFKYKQGKVYKSQNGFTKLVDIVTYPSELKATGEKITAGPYPDINIDNLPFFVPICSMATGTTLIHDWVYENRIIYFMELNKLGADILLADPHRAFVRGKTKFTSGQLACPPALRPAMIILIAMLGAEGTSILRNVYSIRRGYEEIAERLNSLGAKIEVVVS